LAKQIAAPVRQFEARVEAADEGGLWVQYIVDIAAEDVFPAR
jgi:hypothetical protein